MRTVIALSHSGGKGKTGTLRELASLLLEEYPNHTAIFPKPIVIPLSGDFRLIIEINGKIIGIESQGDPKTDLKNRLIELADNFKCDIIFCTSRTRGETVHSVDHLFHTREFKTIWTSTYQIEGEENQLLVNKLKAKHLIELIQKLSLI